MSQKLKAAVVNPDPSAIVIKSSHYYYRALATQMKEGSRVFVPDMGRRQAHYAKKVFTELVGSEVLGYQIQLSGKDGYLFHLKKKESSSAPAPSKRLGRGR